MSKGSADRTADKKAARKSHDNIFGAPKEKCEHGYKTLPCPICDKCLHGLPLDAKCGKCYDEAGREYPLKEAL
ncbi:MAG: hypothetical protein KAR06_11135 [Deltaproteobacteria bacterium]|nr:hypothetical protein [Deltaproteobacteria bacterium]